MKKNIEPNVPIVKGRREDFDIILNLVEKNSTVLDLGCGDGELLKILQEKKNVRGRGVEISFKGIAECIKRGISVFNGDIDEGLSDYKDKSFDYVILSQTLHVIKNPDIVLKEMLRVGNHAIVTFPNFAFYKIRFSIMFRGELPEISAFTKYWKNAELMHFITINQFRKYCKKNEIVIIKEIPTGVHIRPLKPFQNLFAQYGIYLLKSL